MNRADASRMPGVRGGVLALLLLPMASHAAEPADPFADPFAPRNAGLLGVKFQRAAKQGRDESAPPEPAEPPTGLAWVNGDRLPGRVVECTEDRLVFQSPLFMDPVSLKLDALTQFDQTAASAPPSDPLAVRLRDGSVIMARVLEITDSVVRVESARCGALALHRSEVTSLERTHPDAAETAKVEKATKPENAADAPAPVGGYFVRGNFPEQVDIVLAIRLDPAPSFRLEIAGNGSRRITLETMASDLVLQGREFSSLRHFDKEETMRVTVHLFWNQATGRTALYSEGPGILAETNKAPTSVTRITASGLHIQDKSIGKAEPSIQFLGMNSWDGELPRAPDGTSAGLRLGLGREVLGEVLSAHTAGVRLRKAAGSGAEEITVPWADITKVRLAAQPARATVEGVTELWFADDAVVKGTLLSLRDGVARMRMPAAPEPVSIALDGLRRMILPGMTRGIIQDGSPFDQLDTIELGGARARGSLSPSEGGELRWVLPGADAPARLARQEDLRFVSSSDTIVPPAPLFFLTDGEVLAGALTSMDGKEIHIAGEHSQPFRMPGDWVRAVQFGGTRSELSGFTDEEWTVLQGGPLGATRTAAGVVLRDGVIFAHPSILRGNQLQFAIQSTRYLSILRARLFCEGAGPNPGAATTVVFRCFGSEIRYGLEAGDGFQDEWGKANHAFGEIVPVKMRWEGGWLYLTVGGGATLQLPARTRAGIGLRFEIESAGRFRAGDNSISLSRFQVGALAGQTWIPSVSSEAKSHALTLPRFRKDDPPRQALIATNRDVLRGEIESAAADHLLFRSGLHSFRVPMDRVAAAIWLRPPGEQGRDPDPFDGPPAEPPSPALTWLLLKSGAQFGVSVKKITSGVLYGSHPIMGECQVPLDHLQGLVCRPPEVPPALVEFDSWHLSPAQEPVIAKGGEAGSPLIGQEAPDIVLALLDAGEFDLKKHRGKVVVLDFWATWCGPCIRSLPELVREMARFPEGKVTFVAVNQGESEEAARQFLLSRKLELHVALDPRQSAGQLLGASAIPHTVIVDREGKIIWVRTGTDAHTAQEAAAIVARELAR